MKRTVKFLVGIISFFLTAVSVSEAIKKKEELEKKK